MIASKPVMSNIDKTILSMTMIRMYGTKLEYGSNKHVEFYSCDTNEIMLYQTFGKMLRNLFELPEMWPRIGESVRDVNGKIYVVEDILTYMEDAKYVKRFYLRKKSEQKTIVDV